MAGNLTFKCYRCVHCCFFVSEEESPILLKDELENLTSEAARLGVELKFDELDDGFFRLVLRGFCPFYDIASRECIIHPKKPISCKMYPLLLNLRTGDIHVSVACDWVIENMSKLMEGDYDLGKVFENELKWVKILYRRLIDT